MTKRMPEDEAIDFTFTLGVDTSHSVAQAMHVESTLKKEDIPKGTIQMHKNVFKIYKIASDF